MLRGAPRQTLRSRRWLNTAYDLHPNGQRLGAVAARDQGGAAQDKVVFVFHSFNYFRTLAPAGM